MEEPEIDVVTAQQLKKTLDALNDTVKAINKHIEGVSEGINETKKSNTENLQSVDEQSNKNKYSKITRVKIKEKTIAKI